MCLVDEKRRIIDANRAFREVSGWPEPDTGSNIACGGLGCINSLEDPNGCGEGPNCVECTLRESLDDTIETGTPHNDIKFHATILREGSYSDRAFLCTTSRFDGSGPPRVLICLQDVTELERAKKKYRIAVDFTYDWENWLGPDGKFIYVSPSCERITGYKPEEFMVDPGLLMRLIHPEDRDLVGIHHENEIKNRGAEEIPAFRIIKKEGETRYIEHRCRGVFSEEGTFLGVRASNRDITKEKELEIENEIIISLLRIINSSEQLENMIKESIEMLKGRLGFEAIGIRIVEGEDYPYFLTKGFPEKFVEAERYLCARDIEGQIMRDEIGNPILECMCGNIIRGRYDHSLPFFTEKGSFWTNSTTQLLASTSEEDRQARTRNRCNGEGYESVALIPLKTMDETLGLIQFNDSRTNMFTDNMIDFLERVSDYLSVAIAHRRSQELLQRSEERLSLAQQVGKMGSYEYILPEGTFRWSRQTFRIMGKDPETGEPTLREFMKIIHPEDMERMGDALSDSVSERKEFRITYRIIHPGGEVRFIKSIGKPILNDEGEVGSIFGTIMDITEEKRMEAEIRESERFNRMLNQTVPNFLYIYDVEKGKNTWINDNYKIFHENEVGGNSGEMTYDDIIKFIHPDDMKKFENAHKELSRGSDGLINIFDFRIKTINGLRWFHHQSRIFKRRENGQIEKTIGSMFDITDLKELEQSLRERERFNSILNKTIPNLIYIYDNNLKKNIWVNDNYSIFLKEKAKRKRIDLSYNDIISFIHPDDICKIEEGQKDLDEETDGFINNFEFRIETEDGWRWFHHQGKVFKRDEDGKIEQTIGTMFDITDRKKMELAVKESEELFRSLTTMAPVGIFRTDADGHCIFVNDKWCEITGVSREEALGEGWIRGLHPDDSMKVTQTWYDLVATDSKWNMEYRFKHKDGTVRWVKGTAIRLLDHDGIFSGIIGVNSDITSIKETESILKESESRYRSLFETNPDPIFLMDKKGWIQGMNASAHLIVRLIAPSRKIDTIMDLFADDEKTGSIFMNWFSSSMKDSDKKIIEIPINGERAKVTLEFHLTKGLQRGDKIQYQLIGHDVTMRKIFEENIRKASMNFIVEDGTTYLISEPAYNKTADVLKELQSAGYRIEGWIRYQERLKDIMDRTKVDLLPLTRIGNNDKIKETSTETIENKCRDMGKGSVLFIGSLDYLILEHGMKKILKLMQNIRDISMMKKNIVIVTLDPRYLTREEIDLFKKDLSEIIPRKRPEIPINLRNILDFVRERNFQGRRPDYSEVSSEMGISKPTARKRIRELMEMGLLLEIRKGRMKLLEVDESINRTI